MIKRGYCDGLTARHVPLFKYLYWDICVKRCTQGVCLCYVVWKNVAECVMLLIINLYFCDIISLSSLYPVYGAHFISDVIDIVSGNKRCTAILHIL